MKPSELTIHHAQVNQPWTVPYSKDTILASQDTVPHILATHTVLHAMKSVGKLATVYEELDHTGGPINVEQVLQVSAMSADLVTAALRLANLYGFDLAEALAERVLEKNGVNILLEVRA